MFSTDSFTMPREIGLFYPYRKVHGEISGFPVGSSWENRIGCSQAGVHAPLRGGIHGNAMDGAFSVVL